jgi:hypothetical protein
MKTIRRSVAVAALALGLGAGSVAHAGTTTADFHSDSNTTKRKLGSFTGTATYDDVAGLLTVTVNNTSAAGNNGAALTGIAFNVAGTATAAYRDGDDAATARADEDAYDDARSRGRKHLVKAKPLGNFEAGAALNGKFGAASRRVAALGVSAGSSRTFVFDVSGAAAGMTVNDFLGGNVGIAAAFRGKKADKVGGVLTPAAPGSPLLPGDGENDGGAVSPPVVIDIPEITPPAGGVIPPVIIGGGDNGPGTGGGIDGGNQGGPAAVPLPPAVWSGLLGLGALATPKLKRKLRELL